MYDMLNLQPTVALVQTVEQFALNTGKLGSATRARRSDLQCSGRLGEGGGALGSLGTKSSEAEMFSQ